MKLTILKFTLLTFISSNCLSQSVEINSFDFETRTEKLELFESNNLVNKIKPNHFSNDTINLKESFTSLNYYNSDLSPLFRTRDIFGNINKFPSSTVVKLIKYIKDEEISTCTGTLVYNNYVITAAHCLRKNKGEYPDKILVKPLYDNGKSNFNLDSVFVVKNYTLNSFTNTDADSIGSDLAMYKISSNIGEKLGYIGLDISVKPDTINPVYTFTYPHKSTSHFLKEVKSAQTDSTVIKELNRLIEINDYKTPDFNNVNQYYKYGKIKNNSDSNLFKMKTPYVIPGESGESWITNNYYFLGVLSSLNMSSEQESNEFTAIYCRNEKILSAFLQIILKEK